MIRIDDVAARKMIQRCCDLELVEANEVIDGLAAHAPEPRQGGVRRSFWTASILTMPRKAPEVSGQDASPARVNCLGKSANVQSGKLFGLSHVYFKQVP